ncbi:alpha/beta hydrolase [Nakamurella deserti]|uniref:alpha/beta hydrolase n=1 Tax=Nakamurella deserti TaxID=2164074 RepID=UPI000DBE46E2|nr:alpha/beta hydrolase [Nakamurella deserti]
MDRARPRVRRRVVLTAVTLVTVLLVPVAALWLLQRRIVFQPGTTRPGPAAAAVPGARDVVLHTADGLALDAWYLPAAAGCARTVLVAPGNAGSRADRAALARALGGRGPGVLLLDYRGYGGNPGAPDEPGLLRDATAAVEFLRAEVPGHRLTYFGESLGGAVVVALARRFSPAAVVLRSPFTELAAVAAAQFPRLPVRRMLWDTFPVHGAVGSLDVPVTVVHGERDSLVDPAQSLAVAAAAGARVVAVPGADHNDAALAHGPLVVDAVMRADGGAPECGTGRG